MFLINGYRAYYNPKSEYAGQNGIVYEHIEKASEMLGRKLKKVKLYIILMGIAVTMLLIT